MGASKFGCYVLWWRNCSIYLDYHKWMLQIWMRQVLLFEFPFLDLMKIYGILPKTYDSLELKISNFHTLILFIFLYVYVYFHVYFLCLTVHVLHSKEFFFEIFGIFFIRNSFYF